MFPLLPTTLTYALSQAGCYRCSNLASRPADASPHGALARVGDSGESDGDSCEHYRCEICRSTLLRRLPAGDLIAQRWSVLPAESRIR